MKSKAIEKLVQRHLNGIILIGILLLASLIFGNFFRSIPVYAMQSSSGLSMWSDVVAMGDEYSWDHYNPNMSYVVGTGCTETDYESPDYSYRVRTTVTAPNGSYITQTSNTHPLCARTDVYMQMQGAVGSYNVDTNHYSVMTFDPRFEENMGCTHTFINAEARSELYYKYDHWYPYSGPNDYPMKACVYINCPGNRGQPCYSDAGYEDRRPRSDPCPAGILLVSQRVWKILGIEKCKIINHHDFWGSFSCP